MIAPLGTSLYFQFRKGDLDGLNYRFVIIEQSWDHFASIDCIETILVWALISQMVDKDCPNFRKAEIDRYWGCKVNRISCR